MNNLKIFTDMNIRIHINFIFSLLFVSGFYATAQPSDLQDPDSLRIACLREQFDKNDGLQIGTLSTTLSELSKKSGTELAGSGINGYKELQRIYTKLKTLDTTSQIDCLTEFVRQAFHGSYRNHLEALELLITEIRQLQSRNTAIQFVNYKNAYYNLLRSKAQLTAEIAQYFNLAETQIANKKLMQAMNNSIINVNGKVLEVKGISDSSKILISSVETSTNKMDGNLSSAFKPYFPVSSKAVVKTQYDKSDRIKSVGDLMLYDARRNNWWRALLGGAAGGVVAGLLIGLFK